MIGARDVPIGVHATLLLLPNGHITRYRIVVPEERVRSSSAFDYILSPTLRPRLANIWHS